MINKADVREQHSPASARERAPRSARDACRRDAPPLPRDRPPPPRFLTRLPPRALLVSWQLDGDGEVNEEEFMRIMTYKHSFKAA